HQGHQADHERPGSEDERVGCRDAGDGSGSGDEREDRVVEEHATHQEDGGEALAGDPRAFHDTDYTAASSAFRSAARPRCTRFLTVVVVRPRAPAISTLV